MDLCLFVRAGQVLVFGILVEIRGKYMQCEKQPLILIFQRFTKL